MRRPWRECRGELSVLLVRPGDQAGRPMPALRGRAATVGRAPGRHRAFDRGDEGARRRDRPRAAADRRQDAGRALPAGHPRPRRRGTDQAGHPAAPGAAPPARAADRRPPPWDRHPGCPARAPRPPRRIRRRPRPGAAWLDADDPEHPPEASSREVQNIPLGLGALLLGGGRRGLRRGGHQLDGRAGPARHPAPGHRADAARPAGTGPARAHLDRRDHRRGRPAAGAARRRTPSGRWTGSASAAAPAPSSPG